MHILITGGSGFLGGALTERLRREGADVTWLSRRGSTPAPEGVEVRTYSQLWADDRFDAVINLAGAGIADRRWSDARRQQLRDSRLIPTRVVTDWIRSARVPPRVLLSGSAIGWYGAQGDVPLDETSAPRDEFQHRLCADWEQAACVVEDRVPVVRLRTGVVLHPAGGMLQRLRLPFALGLGARLGDGRQVLSWIAREDWVAATLSLLHAHLDGHANAPTGAFNLTAPEPVDNARFTRALADALRRPALLAAPARVLALGLGDMATLLVDGQRVLPARLQARDFAFTWPTLEPYLDDVLR
ncbi:TIGR01777 family oxidoreductase [Luteimonas sp BLCC-B24]|uniref:TIGR01777 family oxidoreductase n=1 Tax=Luteimonas sp. BLCC-B24 TaxID=3025317 RepID=UPI00234C2F69|nr:TIGR01777 family oxidoreductase [Luteimonas sp. BLCC-B24]MDC7806108.1 TIGR01777 family oxidoreductase [Luteimonas sp. BLCC-B24]